ncbi:unnamed protein product [Parascedosporium putredinis]|uniref:NF-X1-type domain-containing protein n=1 Tax=Parascedosporium putredinis TaxID=1442378 RepID=A0A9P1H6V1_9PEZI|nr:unnamed protein product [Parascedosporium putredinis]CAI7998030.1 unnamed protein product [Parascedosporium putredinis]
MANPSNAAVLNLMASRKAGPKLAVTRLGERVARGWERGRGRRAAPGPNTFRAGAPVAGTTRTFGGHLTTEDSETPTDSMGLDANASEFVPGRPENAHRLQSRPAQRPKKAEGPLAPKSDAPDLPARIHEDISNLQYECVICTSEVIKESQSATQDPAPCDLMGPSQPCFCGKQCYCGKTVKEIPCEERGDEEESYNYGQVATEGLDEAAVPKDSYFSGCIRCQEPCGRTYDCGKHSCDKPCHPQDSAETHCPRSPDVVTHCFCGKTTLQSLLDTPRQSCEDTIPHCAEECGRLLDCGHRCKTARRKNKLAAPEEDIEDEHLCTRTCGRKLKCGTHSCQQICHKGPCPSCLEAIFEEISCACGRTVLLPPQPCGTKPPECRYDCTKSPPCGHPRIQHKCHQDDTPCPKCPFLVEKPCICGKQTLKNQPCWFEEARCGLPCGRKLKCGAHTCRKPCHRDGHCEDEDIAGSHCAQSCGKTRKSCDHACQDTCHSPFACKEDKPCAAKVAVTLPCDDECARLKRNAALAEALKIAPEHGDNHIPYSDETLDMFKENQSWALIQEKELREFSADETKKVHRFKPIESQDMPPHRSSLIQATKIRIVQASEASRVAAAAAVALMGEPFNAFLLTSPRFGLTVEDVEGALQKELASQPGLKFTVTFLPSDEVVVQAASRNFAGAMSATALENMLSSMKAALARTVSSQDLARSVALCHADASSNITRRERGANSSAGGWNTVVSRSTQKSTATSASASSASTTRDPTSSATTEAKPGRLTLGLKKKKKLPEPEPVDDWLEAAEQLEE